MRRLPIAWIPIPLLFVLVVGCGTAERVFDRGERTAIDVVDPFIGTAGDHGQLHPAASLPFGMVKLGPDTLIRGHAGYDYNVSRIRGFSHTRIGGVGCSGAGGNILLRPSIGARPWFAVPVDKCTETAEPGYYAVTVVDDPHAIRSELTVTDHAGFHRYWFPASGEATIFLNVNRPFDTAEGSCWSVNATGDEISGSVSGRNVCGRGRYTIYFSALFSRPFDSLQAVPGNGGGSNAYAGFRLDGDEAILVKVGLSSVDVDEARSDRDREIPAWDFERVRAEARGRWERHLGLIEVEGNADEETLFYTMLYRSSLVPVNITSGSGQYRGTDGEVHAAPGYEHYHCWSLWDTYRTKYPLITLIDPDRASDMLRSLVDLYVQGKTDWSGDNEPFPTVRTEHAVALLLDGLRKGIEGFGLEEAFAAIVDESNALPLDSPDRRLEASYDLWATAHIAAALGEDDVYQEVLTRSAAYRTTWEETFREMGDDADVMHAQGLYEGTLWQYRWAVVHDIPGMIGLAGGASDFRDQLDEFFDSELYNHGNEPDLHVPFLFNFVGTPWRTQALVRTILTRPMNQWYGTHVKWTRPFHGRIYRPEPAAFIPEMDDDAGTMAAWFVLASIGLYPVTVGQPVYQLTAPIFPAVAIHLDGDPAGRAVFTIAAEGLSEESIYVQSATLDGEPLDRAWIRHDELAAGGELRFTMGPEPNESWGAAPEDAPPGAFEGE